MRTLLLSLGLSLTLTTAAATGDILWLSPDLSPVLTQDSPPGFYQERMLFHQEGSDTPYGYLDLQGELEISPSFVEAKAFSAQTPLAPAAIYVLPVQEEEEELEEQEEEGEEEEKEPAPDASEEEPSQPEPVLRYGFIDTQGDFVLPPLYQDAQPFSQGLAAVTLDGETWGFINEEGEMVIQPLYHSVEPFSQGYSAVSIEENFGLLDLQGDLVLPLVYEGLSTPGDGLFPSKKGDLSGYIDLEGDLIVAYRYSEAGNFYQELAQVEKDGLWGYLDKEGRLLAPLSYQKTSDFSQGLAWVQQEGRLFYINTSGQIQIDDLQGLSSVSSFSQGYAIGKSDAGYGFFDKTGTSVLPFVYQEALPVSQGAGLVYDGTAWGLFYPQARSSHWAENYVSQAESLSLLPDQLQGVELTDLISRGQFISLTIQLFDLLTREEQVNVPELSQNPFQDTRDLAVRRAYDLGLAYGLTADYFGTQETLTREQAATIFTVLYTQLTQEEVGIAQAPPFDDHQEISSWAQNSVYFLAEKGVLTGVGDNLFCPQDSISAESALVMALAMNNLLEPQLHP